MGRVSLGGEGPTAMSWRVWRSVLLPFCSRVGVASRGVTFLDTFSSRGGDGPQAVDVRSFLDLVLVRSETVIEFKRYHQQ